MSADEEPVLGSMAMCELFEFVCVRVWIQSSSFLQPGVVPGSVCKSLRDSSKGVTD